MRAHTVVADAVVELHTHADEPLVGAELVGGVHLGLHSMVVARREHDAASPTACAGQLYTASTRRRDRTGPDSKVRTRTNSGVSTTKSSVGGE